MKKDPENKYGEIVTLLLKSGLVSSKQVAHGQRIHSKLATPVPLLNVLKDLNVVTDEMVRKSLMESGLSIRIGELLAKFWLSSTLSTKDSLIEYSPSSWVFRLLM